MELVYKHLYCIFNTNCNNMILDFWFCKIFQLHFVYFMCATGYMWVLEIKCRLSG